MRTVGYFNVLSTATKETEIILERKQVIRSCASKVICVYSWLHFSVIGILYSFAETLCCCGRLHSEKSSCVEVFLMLFTSWLGQRTSNLFLNLFPSPSQKALILAKEVGVYTLKHVHSCKCSYSSHHTCFLWIMNGINIVLNGIYSTSLWWCKTIFPNLGPSVPPLEHFGVSFPMMFKMFNKVCHAWVQWCPTLHHPQFYVSFTAGWINGTHSTISLRFCHKPDL